MIHIDAAEGFEGVLLYIWHNLFIIYRPGVLCSADPFPPEKNRKRSERKEMEKPKVTESLITNYALGQAMNTMAFTVPTLFLTVFMTDYLGISPVAMANGMFIARLVDFVVSIVAGMIIEKVHMKHGKYLSWIRLLTATLFFGNIVQMLDTTPFVKNATARLVIVMIFYMMFHCSMNFNATSRAAILPKFCGADMELRKKFTARQTQLGALVSIFGSAIIVPLVNFVAKVTGQESLGYFIGALIFSGLFVVFNLMFCKQAAPFDPPEDAAVAARRTPTVGQMVESLVTNPQMLILFGCFTVFTMGNQVYAGVTTYFFRVTGNFSRYSFALTARAVCAFVASMVAPPLARKLGKKAALVTGWSIVAVAGLIIKFFCFRNGQANIVLMTVCMCLFQAALYLYMGFMAVMYLDCGEYGYYKSGIDNRTMAVTVMNWPTKIGFMFGGSIVGYMLAWAGYDAAGGVNGAQGAFADMGKFMTTMGIIPAIGAGIAAVCIFLFYKLDDKTAAEYAKANVEREAAEKAAEGK
jgi:Na+/melibiose symporter-like transporter